MATENPRKRKMIIPEDDENVDILGDSDREDDNSSGNETGLFMTSLELIRPGRENIRALNEEQKEIVDWIDNPNHDSVSIFITGAAGTGKSFVLDRLEASLKSRGRKVKRTATTGPAASIIGGQTLHRALRIRYVTNFERYRDLLDNQPQAFIDEWCSYDDLIIDECSQLSPDVFDMVVRGIAHMRNQNHVAPIRYIFVGDPYQLPPVMRQGERQRRKSENLPIYIQQTDIWKHQLKIKVFILEKIERQRDPIFARMLGMVRRGQITDEVDDYFQDIVQRTFVDRGDDRWKTDGVSENAEYEDGLMRIRSRNEDVNSINSSKLNCGIADDEFVFSLAKPIMSMHRVTATRTRDGNLIDTFERIDNPNNLESHVRKELEDIQVAIGEECQMEKEPKIRIGSEIIFVNNVDVEAGVSNGARAVIVGIRIDPTLAQGISDPEGYIIKRGEDAQSVKRCIRARLNMPVARLVGSGRLVFVGPHDIKRRTDDNNYEVRITGLPIRLASAITSHKAQGATIEGRAEMIIATDQVFDYGQAYVALSRVTTSANLCLLKFDRHAIMVDPVVSELESKRFNESYREDEQSDSEPENDITPSTQPRHMDLTRSTSTPTSRVLDLSVQPSSAKRPRLNDIFDIIKKQEKTPLGLKFSSHVTSIF